MDPKFEQPNNVNALDTDKHGLKIEGEVSQEYVDRLEKVRDYVIEDNGRYLYLNGDDLDTDKMAEIYATLWGRENESHESQLEKFLSFSNFDVAINVKDIEASKIIEVFKEHCGEKTGLVAYKDIRIAMRDINQKLGDIEIPSIEKLKLIPNDNLINSDDIIKEMCDGDRQTTLIIENDQMLLPIYIALHKEKNIISFSYARRSMVFKKLDDRYEKYKVNEEYPDSENLEGPKKVAVYYDGYNPEIEKLVYSTSLDLFKAISKLAPLEFFAGGPTVLFSEGKKGRTIGYRLGSVEK
ncbi:MAG: hypothetical protein Q8P11_01230 [bacterium]|nr:hypothetical protein [bacterium]